ncbi:MAG: hypothetical protein Tsb0021_13830 [Chlamydiales bacterium]
MAINNLNNLSDPRFEEYIKNDQEKKGKSFLKRISQIFGKNSGRESRIQGVVNRNTIPPARDGGENETIASVSSLTIRTSNPSTAEEILASVKEIIGPTLNYDEAETDIYLQVLRLAVANDPDFSKNFDEFIQEAKSIRELQLIFLEENPNSFKTTGKDFESVLKKFQYINTLMQYIENIQVKHGKDESEIASIINKFNLAALFHATGDINNQLITDGFLGAVIPPKPEIRGDDHPKVAQMDQLRRLYNKVYSENLNLASQTPLQVALRENMYLSYKKQLFTWATNRWEVDEANKTWKHIVGLANVTDDESRFKVYEAEFTYDLSDLGHIKEPKSYTDVFRTIKKYMSKSQHKGYKNKDFEFVENKKRLMDLIEEMSHSTTSSVAALLFKISNPSLKIPIENIYDRTEEYLERSQFIKIQRSEEIEIERTIGVLTKEERIELQKIFENKKLVKLLKDYLKIAKEVANERQSQSHINIESNKVSRLIGKQQQIAKEANRLGSVNVHALGNLTSKIMAYAFNPSASSKVEDVEV